MENVIKSAELVVKSKTAGAELTSIVADGIEYLWQGDPNFWGGQAPVCFPIVGSLRDNRANCSGGEIKGIARHGFVKAMEFEVGEATDDCVSYVLKSNDETKEIYPYDFTFTMAYKVEGKTLSFIYKVKNDSDVVMPFHVGGHPGFNCPLLEGEAFEDYQIQFEVEEDANLMFPMKESPALLDDANRRVVLDHEKVLQLSHDYFQNDGLFFDKLNSRSIKYINPATGKGLQFDMPQCTNLVLWTTAKPAKYICIEPWIGMCTCSTDDDVFEHRANIQLCQPGEEKVYTVNVTVL
ncbi:MAG: aldose 1-epimerase family protein [Clostridia bacterium]|nr:aldose 1-epimerase family protein [Clostridia bacterium]